MTRKEEIIQTACQKEKEVGFSQFVKDAKGVNSSYGIGFLEGAEWADNHPNLTWKDIRKICLIAKNVHKYYGFWHEVKKKKPEGALKELLDNIDPVEYEKVRQEMLEQAASEDLEKAADAFAGVNYDYESESDSFYHMVQKDAFKAGANWQKEQMEKKLDENALLYIARQEGIEIGKAEMKKELDSFWKPADGDDLPIFDREVIVLYQRYPLEGNEYAVCFGHRPREYWDGKNIDTGEVTRYYPKRYDKGGWNQPDVVCWLDCKLPFKEEEEV